MQLPPGQESFHLVALRFWKKETFQAKKTGRYCSYKMFISMQGEQRKLFSTFSERMKESSPLHKLKMISSDKAVLVRSSDQQPVLPLCLSGHHNTLNARAEYLSIFEHMKAQVTTVSCNA